MEKQSNKKQLCPYLGCGATFNRPHRLVQHLNLHNNIRTFTCFVENCSKSYSCKSHLDRHIKLVHLKIQSNVVYSCPKCLKSYKNRQNLKRHINLKHIVNEPFYCDICRLDFRKKHLLTAHMYQHTGIKSFNCDKCGQEFVSLYDKKKHMRHHKIYKCDECPLEFNLWSAYQYHKRTEHIKSEFICNDCGRKFKERGHIVRHIKTHTQEYMQVFPCPYEDCHREYSRNNNLKQHILMKHEKVKHDCHLCETKLSTKAALARHIRTHTKVIKKPPKTLATGRKPRKDIGVPKKSTALRLAGIEEPIDEVDEDSMMPRLLEASLSIMNAMTTVTKA